MSSSRYTIVRFHRNEHGIDRRQAFVVCSYPSMKDALARCLRLNEPFTSWYYEIVALPANDDEAMDLATRLRPMSAHPVA
ncbi:MAG: hypothetical protein D6685_12705 [Bacteroidetes bacterium]|nr:hypothetical protein AWN76_003930 [Rhodothermaceae bacterium RA]RMH57382.1 MAG: hypothetical protein D6685_12705 [Bacteroidota bacterium]